MSNETNIGERMMKTETKIDSVEEHIRDCVNHFRPSLEARLRTLEVKFATYTGGLAALQVAIAWALAVYLKKSP